MAFIKENKSALEALYSQIGNQLVAELPDGWTHVCLGFFVDKQGQEEMLIYTSQDDGRHWHDFMDDVFESEEIMVGVFDCKDSCQELYALCTKVGDRWSNFTMIIETEGHFRVDYSYDPIEKITPLVKSTWIGEYM